MVRKNKKRLPPREVEVLSLVAQGLINKEIADRLHISLATVITHRKNIVEKLGVRSVPALTMYAVINGYVDVHKI
jgi:DNA-binding NarL/FixJ family response regulator